nr:Yip1 family protein [Caulobacter sp. 17J80-11]
MDRLTGLLRTPSVEWERVAEAPRPVAALALTVVMASVAALGLHFLVPTGALAWSARDYGGFYLAAAVHVTASVVLIMLIARLLQGPASVTQAVALVGWAGPAFWLGVALTSWSDLLAAILFLYATYQLFVGLPRVLKTPEAAVAALRILVFFALIASAATATKVREAIAPDLTKDPQAETRPLAGVAAYSTAPR